MAWGVRLGGGRANSLRLNSTQIIDRAGKSVDYGVSMYPHPGDEAGTMHRADGGSRGL